MADGLLVVLIALVLAYVISEVFRHLGLPRVIGQIIAGIILGIPLIKGLLFDEQILSTFAFITKIGIILLFFFIGLEINLGKFKKNFKESSLIAIFNTIIPFVAGFAAGKYLFGFNVPTSLILGISVSVSSQAISLDILEEAKMLKSRIGNLIIASGTVDDVFELLLISFILVLFRTVSLGQPNLISLFFNIMIFVVIIIVARFILIPFSLKIFEKDKSQSILFMGALIIVLLMSYLSELLGISSLIGALIAGILVRQTLITGEDRRPWRKNEISHSIHIISFGFLIPLFFVNVGLNTNLSTLSSNIPLVLAFIVIDIVGTLAGTIIGVMASKGTMTEGFIVGWGVVPKGDTELVIATLALTNGLITVDIFTAIITIAMFSTFIAPIIFKMMIKRHAEMTS